MKQINKLTFPVSIKRHIVTRQFDETDTVVPYMFGPPGAVLQLDASEKTAVREAVLDAFDADSVPELVADTQRDTRDEYELGQATVTTTRVSFEKARRFRE